MKKVKAWVSIIILSSVLTLSSCGQPSETIPKTTEPTTIISTETLTTTQENSTDKTQDSQESSSASLQTEIESEVTTETESELETEPETTIQEQFVIPQISNIKFSISDIKPYSGQAYIVVNNNEPFFSDEDLITQSYEFYGDLDDLGRCSVAYANIGLELMPTEERGSIGQVKPTGWQTVKYDIVDGKYLYNRCHLIGYQLSGENANEQNLITGTRYLNIEGMLPFENMVADYVKETDNHVLYRVTPIFEEDNLLASGVLMEARSVEDNGDGILFCVYAYNVQPGIIIDYATGESNLDIQEETTETPTEPTTEAPQETTVEVCEEEPQGTTYILNTSTKKFHYPSCSSVKQMKDKNKKEYTGNRNDVIDMGYDPCKRCNP